MRYKLTIVFLFMVCGRLLHAQYINTDSLVVVPGLAFPQLICNIDKLDFNLSGPAYLDNLSAGELLLQFSLPCDGKVISRFGLRSGRMHTGIDIKMQKGDTIYAAYNGSVLRSNYCYGYGNLVVIQHEKDFETYYAHLSTFMVKNGDWIRKGEPLGLAGSTGRATTNHLHFEIRENDNPYDPELIYDFENAQIRSDLENMENLAQLQQKLKPKGYSVNEPITQNYVVRSGDSLWKISRHAKTTINLLCQLNNLAESSVLQVGMVLKVF